MLRKGFADIALRKRILSQRFVFQTSTKNKTQGKHMFASGNVHGMRKNKIAKQHRLTFDEH